MESSESERTTRKRKSKRVPVMRTRVLRCDLRCGFPTVSAQPLGVHQVQKQIQVKYCRHTVLRDCISAAALSSSKPADTVGTQPTGTHQPRRQRRIQDGTDLLSPPAKDAVPAEQVPALGRRGRRPLLQAKRADAARADGRGYRGEVEPRARVVLRPRRRRALGLGRSREQRGYGPVIDVRFALSVWRRQRGCFTPAAGYGEARTRAEEADEAVEEADAEKNAEERV
jgi:hypothetical protein